MGFFDSQRAKADARIRAAADGRLEPGEQIVTAFLAVTRLRWWWVVVALFPLFFYFEYKGTERPWWLAGAAIGVVLVGFMRQFFVVATDRRVVVLLLRRMSSKRVEHEHAAPRAEVSAEYRDGLLNARLRLRAGGRDYDLGVGRPFADRARAFAASLTETRAPG